LEYFYTKERSPAAANYFDVETLEAWKRFNSLVFEKGRPSKKLKGLIAVAYTYITRFSYCIEGHARKALEEGATKEEIAEAIAVAVAPNAGEALAHINVSLDVEV
jgi:AhpD family alkylhydroperoxidase